MELDDYLELPEDPELALVVYERNIRTEMWSSISRDTTTDFDRDQKIYYCMKLMAFHDAHQFSFLKKPTLSRSGINFDTAFDSFMDEVTYWTTQIEIRHAQRLRPISTILKLTPEIRLQLHSYINKIRETVLPIQLSDKKKEAILGKLTALADEIDRDRTKTEAWTAFTLELASVGGQAAKELAPAKNLADSIGGLLGKAKDLAESMRAIASPPIRRRIEGPKEEQQTAADHTNLDDEIPF